MAYSPLPNYLRTYRKRTHFTEREIARLIGLTDGSSISRYEYFHRRPSLQKLLRLLVLFECSAQELFAGEYEKAARVVADNAKILMQQFEHVGNTGALMNHKVNLLSQRFRSPKRVTCYI